MEKLISDYYYDPETGLTSPDKLFRKLRKDGYDVTRKMIKEFLEKTETYQTTKESRKTKLYNTINATGVNANWQMDCIVYDRYEVNKYKYIICVVDVFSRKASCRAMTNMRLSTIIDEFKDIIKELGKPEVLNCDNQFNKKEFNKLLDDEKITVFYSETGELNKNAIVERFNRTLAGMIQKWRVSTGKENPAWHKVLQKIVKNYNNTYHRGVRGTPELIFEGKEDNNQDIRIIDDDFSIGDRVRIKVKKEVFDKGDVLKYSKAIYRITGKEGKRYELTDEKTEKVKDRYYKPYELKKLKEIIYHEPPEVEEDKPAKPIKRHKRRMRKEGIEDELKGEKGKMKLRTGKIKSL